MRKRYAASPRVLAMLTLPSSSSSCSALEGKSIDPMLMPSASYSLRWLATSAPMNCACSFSLAKLMHSCEGTERRGEGG